MKLASKLKKRYYNFGGVAPKEAIDHEWQNLTRFKEGFVEQGLTGHQLDYLGGLDLVYKPVWYNLYSNIRRLKRKLR